MAKKPLQINVSSSYIELDPHGKAFFLGRDWHRCVRKALSASARMKEGKLKRVTCR